MKLRKKAQTVSRRHRIAPKAKQPFSYNTHHITLDAIAAELDQAAYKNEIMRFSASFRPVKDAEQDDTWKRIAGLCGDIVRNESSPAACTSAFDSWYTIPALFDHDADAQAAFIRAHPLAMLLSDRHQSAISRWLYAKQYRRSPKDRNRAEELLTSAIPPLDANRPEEFDISLPELLSAYNHLEQYGEDLIKCMKKVRTAEELLQHFPDCKQLERLKPPPNRAGIIVIEAVSNPQIKLPSPGLIAERFIYGRLEMSEGTLRNKWLPKARALAARHTK